MLNLLDLWVVDHGQNATCRLACKARTKEEAEMYALENPGCYEVFDHFGNPVCVLVGTEAGEVHTVPPVAEPLPARTN